MNIAEIVNSGRYEHHHTATHHGYVKRIPEFYEIEPYAGRFGIGYLVLRPRWDTSRYHYCEYWIEKSAD